MLLAGLSVSIWAASECNRWYWSQWWWWWWWSGIVILMTRCHWMDLAAWFHDNCMLCWTQWLILAALDLQRYKDTCWQCTAVSCTTLLSPKCDTRFDLMHNNEAPIRNPALVWYGMVRCVKVWSGEFEWQSCLVWFGALNEWFIIRVIWTNCKKHGRAIVSPLRHFTLYIYFLQQIVPD